MAADDRQRAELAQLLLPRIGEEAAMALLDTLPPTGEPLATAAQVAALEQRMTDRFSAVDQRFTGLDQRFTDLEQRMADRFTALENRMDDRIGGLRDELLAAFRGELVTAVSGQLRAVVLGVLTAVIGIATLALAFAQLIP